MSRPWLAGPLLLVLPFAAACGSDDSVAPSAPVEAMVLSARGVRVTATVARQRTTYVAKHVAMALRDPAVRLMVYADLHGSRIREHKLHFRPYLHVKGQGLRAEMTRRVGFQETDLDDVPDLEFYMPVRAHFANWNGGENLYVATQLEDHGTVHTFDLNGDEVQGVDANAPPNVPTLVVVPSEYKWATSPSFDEIVLPECDPSPCDPPQGGNGGGGTGGSGGTNPNFDSSSPDPDLMEAGLWLTYSNIIDLRESWPRGDPEIEVTILLPGATRGLSCAHEDANNALQRFDQNDNVWPPANSGAVMLMSNSVQQTVYDHYPAGTPDSLRAFRVDVWEDDDERCVVHSGDSFTEAVGGMIQLIAGVTLGVAPSQVRGRARLASTTF